MLTECLLGYKQIKKDLIVLIYLKEGRIKRMKYGKHGVKEEDFGAIYPELSKEWSQTES